MAEEVTEGRGYQLPDPTNLLSADVFRLIAAVEQIDVDIVALLAALAAKAPTSHTHSLADIVGLALALDGKANSSHTHALSSLSDVSTTGAAAGHVIMRVGSSWVSAAIAPNNVTGLEAILAGLQAQIDEISGGTF